MSEFDINAFLRDNLEGPIPEFRLIHDGRTLYFPLYGNDEDSCYDIHGDLDEWIRDNLGLFKQAQRDKSIRDYVVENIPVYKQIVMDIFPDATKIEFGIIEFRSLRVTVNGVHYVFGPIKPAEFREWLKDRKNNIVPPNGIYMMP